MKCYRGLLIIIKGDVAATVTAATAVVEVVRVVAVVIAEHSTGKSVCSVPVSWLHTLEWISCGDIYGLLFMAHWPRSTKYPEPCWNNKVVSPRV